MLLLCLDLSRRCGVAYGDTADKPIVETWDLGSGYDGGKHYAGTLGYRLRDHFRNLPRPDRVVVEEYMPPAASGSGAATESQILLHGALHGVCGIYRLPVTAVRVAEARKHFCGRATALPRGKGTRTPKEKAEARKANKAMVLERAKLLGYLPADCKSDDQADAAALWEWALGNLAKKIPKELQLFT